MQLLDAAQKSSDWKPEMKDWQVVSVSAQIGTGLQTLELGLTGPWKPDGPERVVLSFDYQDAIPAMQGVVGWKTLVEMDRMLCPEGLILVWDEIEESRMGEAVGSER